jgi:signal transduction histidine kinase
MGIGDGGILIVHDTTDISLRRLQEEFVGVVAHELRTPLTALRGYLQMLQRRGRDTGPRPILPLAIEQADRLQRLVEELFDVTRVERGGLTIHPEPVGIGRLIDETVEIASGISERHRFRVERPEADILVPADPARIQQALLNLLMNAIVHAPDAPDVDVRVRRLRRRAEIEIEDHGPGIPPGLMGRLFSRFEQGPSTTGRRGLGLGLFIAREIVLAHGGTIDVDSAVGEGTTFTVRLPLRVPEGDDAGPPSRPVAPSNGRRAPRRAASRTDGRARRSPARD